MKEYTLNLTKDKFDSIKYALSIAQLQLEQKANISAWGNTEASEAYKEQSQKMEELLKELSKLKGKD